MTDTPKRVALATFGCKVNQYESACIAQQFTDRGWAVVPFSQQADVYVINSCTVTGQADATSRKAIRRALDRKAENPRVKVAVTGCWAQRFPERALAVGDVDLVCGNREKARLFELLESGARVACSHIADADCFDEMSADRLPGRSRAFVKVQDGCDFGCAYCAVHIARGPSRSRPLAAIVDQVERLAAHGYREIVLGGINLGLWRDGERGIPALAHRLAEVDGIERVRLSSLEPQFLSPAFVDELFACNAVARHLHVPLQSGSDDLLRAVGRRYDTALFRRHMEYVLSCEPHCALGFDVIVGLPGEMDERFAETLDFLRNTDFTYLHVFAYSRRPGTPAATMPGHVHGATVKERSRILSELSDEKSAAYRQRLLRDSIPLWAVAETHENGLATGLSDHWVRVCARTDGDVLRGVPVHERDGGLELRESTQPEKP